MNFEHTEDRRMLSDMLRRFVAEQSDFATRDRNAHSERGYSLELWQRYAELGAIGALFSEADGGWAAAASTSPSSSRRWAAGWRWNRCSTP